jgi:hypothetical protein
LKPVPRTSQPAEQMTAPTRVVSSFDRMAAATAIASIVCSHVARGPSFGLSLIIFSPVPKCWVNLSRASSCTTALNHHNVLADSCLNGRFLQREVFRLRFYSDNATGQDSITRWQLWTVPSHLLCFAKARRSFASTPAKSGSRSAKVASRLRRTRSHRSSFQARWPDHRIGTHDGRLRSGRRRR